MLSISIQENNPLTTNFSEQKLLVAVGTNLNTNL